MRQLCNAKNVGRSLAATVTVAVLCGPYLHFKSAALDLETPFFLLLAGLFFLTFVIWQMAEGWTSDEIRMLPDIRRNRALARVVGATLLLALASVFVDPWIAQRMPGFYPKDLREFAVTLPFRATFQALIMIVFPYAFATRLVRNPTVALVVVGLFTELLAILNLSGIGSSVAVVYMIFSGVVALILALAFRLGGALAVAFCAGAFYSRFLFHLIS